MNCPTSIVSLAEKRREHELLSSPAMMELFQQGMKDIKNERGMLIIV